MKHCLQTFSALPLLAVASLCTGVAADDTGIATPDSTANVRGGSLSIAAELPSESGKPALRDRSRGAQPIGTCDTYDIGFESPTYSTGPIDGQNGWTVFEAAGPDFPIVSNENPADGSQHLRNVRNTAVEAGTNNGAFSPDCIPGATSMSVDVYISNEGGADYRVQPQAPSQEFLTAQVLFVHTGEIVVLDEIDETLQLVDTGTTWVCGEYKQLDIVMDNDENTIEYYYDGELIYTGIVFAGTIIEHVIFGSDNFHLEGEFGDFDNFVAPADVDDPAPKCEGDLNGDDTVNVSDMLILLGEWGSCAGCDSDLNGDDTVNVSDLLILLGNWGACPEAIGGEVVGACCVGDTCSLMTEDNCDAAGGTFGGNCTTCDQIQCADATTCAGAQPIAIDDVVTVDTSGFPQGDIASCGDAAAPNAGTAWYTVTGDGTEFSLSTCNTNMPAGTNVAVFCGLDCENLNCTLGSTGDILCPNNSLNATATWCAQEGVQYFIAVWGDNTEGEIEFELSSNGQSCTSSQDCGGPVCTQPDENCQVPTTGTFATSDSLSGFKIAEDFNTAEAGDISTTCWEGVELGFQGGFTSCANLDGEGHPFRVTYFADDAGAPGAVIGGPFVAEPEFEKLDELGFGGGIVAGLFSYSMEHDPVNVDADTCYWVEIVKETPDGGCRFLWSPSNEGNGRYAQTAETAPSYGPGDMNEGDRGFCVEVELGDSNACIPGEGACCVDGSCSLTTAAECDALGGCYTPGATCGSVDCVQETYAYDCNVTLGGIGAGGGTILWVVAYDVQPGAETIDSILTGFGTSGNTAGDTLNWAVYDTATVPENTPAVRSGSTTVTDPTQDQTITFTPVTITSGTFFVAIWKDYPAETFPAPYDDSVDAAPGTIYAGTVEPVDADSLTDLDELVNLNDTLTGVWRLRAD